MSQQPQTNTEDTHSLQSNKKLYDPDSFPPVVEIAIKHGKACRIGIPLKQDMNMSQTLKKTCVCCGYDTRVQPIGVCESYTSFLYLGQGYPLFFNFVNWSIGLMFISTLIFSFYAMYDNYSGSSCVNTTTEAFTQLRDSCPNPTLSPCSNSEMTSDVLSFCRYFIPGIQTVNDKCCTQFCDYYKEMCFKTPWDQFYFPNQQFQQGGRMAQSALVLISVILIVTFLQVMRKRVRIVADELDRDTVTASDYTIIIRNLPAGEYTEQDLWQGIAEWWEGQSIVGGKCEISKINIAYDILHYSQLCVQKNKLALKQRQIKEYQNKHDGKFPKHINGDKELKLTEDLKEIQQKIDQIEKDAQSVNSMKTSQVAFVSFRTQALLREVVRATKFSPTQRFYYRIKESIGLSSPRIRFKGRVVDIERAPEPTDVQWENCGFTPRQKTIQRVKSVLFTTILLFVVFVAFMLIQDEQTKIFYQFDEAVSYNEVNELSLSFLFSVVVVIVNGILTVFITYLTKMEYQSTLTHYNISMAHKLIWISFLSTAVLTFFSGFIVTKVQYGTNRDRLQAAIQRKGGIGDDIFFIALSNSFSTPVMLLFDPGYFYKLWKRREIANAEEETFMTQGEANTWYYSYLIFHQKRFEGKPILLFEKYCYTLRTIWVAALYAPMIPEIFIISILGFIITYWVEKYLFCRSYARPVNLNPALNEYMIDLLEYLPFFMAIGQFTLNQIYLDNSLTIFVLDIISLVVSSINFIIPGEKLNEMIFDIQENYFGELPYEQAFYLFPTDYDRTNPVTKQAALKQYIKMIKEQPYPQNYNQGGGMSK